MICSICCGEDPRRERGTLPVCPQCWGPMVIDSACDPIPADLLDEAWIKSSWTRTAAYWGGKWV